jgi:hypothetical protein
MSLLAFPGLTWRAALAAVAILPASLAHPVACTALELGLDRDLAPGEYVARAVATSCGVAVGTIRASRDTTFTRGGPGGATGTFAIVEFLPERWLKGGPGTDALRLVDDTETIEDFTVDVPGWKGPGPGASARGHVLAFMHCDTLSLFAPPGTFLEALRAVSRRWVVENASMYELPGFQPWSAEREAAVRAEVARQSPDSLLARSDVVALVRVPPLRVGRQSYAVLEGFRGAAAGDTLRTRLVWGFLHADREGGVALLCLRRAADGVYEPTSMDAGVVALDGDRATAWGSTLADVRARMHRLAR